MGATVIVAIPREVTAAPPTWLDERGLPHAKRPCATCGREAFMPWSVVEWCGHRVEGIPVPTEDGRWRLGEAK